MHDNKEKGNINYFSIGQYWKNHGFPPLSDQSEKVKVTTYFRLDYRRNRPLNEENKPLQLAGSAIQCRYLITPKDVIWAEWVNRLTLVAAASDLAELSDRDSKRCNMAHLFLNTPCNNKNTIEDQTNMAEYYTVCVI